MVCRVQREREMNRMKARTHPWKDSPRGKDGDNIKRKEKERIGRGRVISIEKTGVDLQGSNCEHISIVDKERKKIAMATIVAKMVVTVKVVSKGINMDCGDDKLLPGDIIQEISFPSGIFTSMHAPFHGLSSGLLTYLHDTLFKTFDVDSRTLVHVHVLRLTSSCNSRSSKLPNSTTLSPQEFESVMIPSFLVSHDSKENHKNKRRPTLCLRHTTDGSHLVTFVDSTKEACIALQEMRFAELASQLTSITLKETYVPWAAWEPTIQRSTSQSLIFSIVFFPHLSSNVSSIRSYASVDHTVARAMAWFTTTQTSGVPITLFNLQVEPMLTKVSDQHITSKRTMNATTWEDMCATSNEGVYGIEDYHGIDIGILRVVRLWFVPIVPEISIVLQPEGKGIALGLSVCRTKEGFCYISSVENDTIAEKAGLASLHVAAKREGKLLVISKVEEEKILPSVVSTFGCVRCYDTMSISQKLVMHWHLGHSIQICVLAHGYNMDKPRAKETTPHRQRLKNTTSHTHVDTNTIHDCIETTSNAHGNSMDSSTSTLVDRIGSFSFRV